MLLITKMKFIDPIQLEIKHFRELSKLSNIDMHPNYYSNLMKCCIAILPDEQINELLERFEEIYTLVGLKSLLELEYFLYNVEDYSAYFKIQGDIIADYGDFKVYDEIKVSKFELYYYLEQLVFQMIQMVNEQQKKIPMIFNQEI